MKKNYTHSGFIRELKESIKRESATHKILHLSRSKKLMLFVSILSLSILVTASSNHYFTYTNTHSTYDICDTNMSRLLTDGYFVDVSVKDIQPFIKASGQASANTFQLFTHGKPGELFIEGEWKDAEQIAKWLSTRYSIPFTHLNIYGCEFAKGKKGQAAIDYLEAALSLSIAASDDITGIDGDWELEAGKAKNALKFPTYQSNLQNCNCTEFLYVNEGADGGRVHKFELNENFDPNVDVASDAIANEVGSPWYDNAAAGETLVDPHGLAIDLNGYLYIGEDDRADQGSNIRRLTCDGDIIPATNFAIPDAGYNFTSIGNTLYVGTHDFDAATSNAINAYDLCTGDLLGFYCLNGIAESRDWGLFLDGNGFMYLTSDSFRDNQGGDVPNQLYKFDVNSTSLNAAGEANPVCIDPFISEGASDPVAGNNTLPTAQLFGVTTDSNDNIFIVERTGPTEANGTPVIAAGTARVLKYDSNGNFITSTPWDDLEDGSGYFKAIGIYYSNTLDLLFVSTASPVDPCVALFDTDLNHLGDAIPSPGNGTQSKGINIKRECCPTNSIQEVNQTVCLTNTSELIFLNDVFPCSGGIICEGIWEQQSADPTITYESCNQSIDIIGSGCATFTKSSDGAAANAQCGAFEITLNICFVNEPDTPAIAVTDNDCDADTPGAFTVTTACIAGSTLEWSTDNGTTWSTTAPTYDNANTQTLIARCVNDADNTCVSAESTAVTSSPVNCCPIPNCFGIGIQQN